MTENSKSFEVEAESKRQDHEEQNDELREEKKDEEAVEEELKREFQVGGERRVCESEKLENSNTEESREAQLEILEVTTVSVPQVIQSENDQSGGLQVNSGLEMCVEAKLKKQVEVPRQEVKSIITQGDESQTQNHLRSSVSPSSSSELSPTFVTQTVTSAPSPTLPLPEQRQSPLIVKNACTEDAGQTSPCPKSLAIVPNVRTPIPDGYNWRKYGQKQVKSPNGSRSYYKCTFADCYAKKIECSDHCGHVIEIVNKGTHTHDPPKKNNSTRESKVGSSPRPVLGSNITENAIKCPKETDPEAFSEKHAEDMPTFNDKKLQNSNGSDGNWKVQIKDGHAGEPDPKRRMKKSNLECSGTELKPGKKPKLVVHAVGDVGISGDGYRWRKYGQKMVKGNPHPRNYYRCTSAGCPVRKHIETAVDSTNAVIITYKGVHDHDMPVPKKRHGPPSAPLVAAAAPSMNLQLKKTDAVQKQATSTTQWSVGKEGELTGETLNAGGDKQKTMDSARTLLSIGFEIKPC